MSFELTHRGQEFSLEITHRGQVLTQDQVNALIPVLNKRARSRMSLAKIEEECDKALEAAGCPLSLTQQLDAIIKEGEEKRG